MGITEVRGWEEEWESKPYRDSFALSGSHHDSLPFTYGS